jgi:alkanesulfonate monooxygenase SsuD/methylene tetrahydromethanopterin reductase-like flavin-dependent oxidoreductase (luciferase family)
VPIPDVPAGPVVRFRPAVPVPPVWVGGTAEAAHATIAARPGDGLAESRPG